ncbi:3-phosphoglycerate dehydrogenase [Pelagibacterales bacterium SAG-MED09]|nr:3-phosphoglycerate dehydrogenase [Pelagibacterales bacterium SAG-MED09]
MEYFKKKVLIISPVHLDLISNLKKNKFDVKYLPKISKKKLMKEIAKATVVVLRSGVQLGKDIISKSNNLKFIIRAGSGLDNIDIKEAKKRNIKVFNLPNLNSQSVAEFSFGLLISASRNIVKANIELKNNLWNKPKLYGYELKNKTIGIIGLGAIGSRIAKIAKAFSMNVLANVKNVGKKRPVKVKIVPLNTILKKSDFIIFSVPLNNKTKNLLNNKNSKYLKSHSILINISRGGVINEDVLYTLLNKNKIFAAATDVFLHEKKQNKLFKLKNIIVTPHIGAMTFDAQKILAEKTFEKIKKLVK